MDNCICNVIRKKSFIIAALLLILLLVLSDIFIKSNLIDRDSENEVYSIIYSFTAVGTFLLAFIAWTQLKAIRKELDGTFMLELVKISRDSINFEGETIMMELYNESKSADDEFNAKEFSKKLKERKKNAREYIKFLHFVNHLEFTGFLYQSGHITLEQLHELKGSAILEFRKLMSDEVIEIISEGNPRTFALFKKLAKDLKTYRDKLNSGKVSSCNDSSCDH